MAHPSNRGALTGLHLLKNQPRGIRTNLTAKSPTTHDVRMSSDAEPDATEVARGNGVTNLLPPPPRDVPGNLTQATSKYKRHAWIAGIGVLAFVAVYISLTVWFCWTSYRLIAAAFGPGRNGFWSFIVGVLSGALGIFLVGALSFIKTGGDSKNHEVTAKDEPELFAFLYALADRVGAPRPHRVFISARVNAAVFMTFRFSICWSRRKRI